ncbi:procollagen C-endopeptidase enhancer 2-like [Ranitomeya imitator]|uniref:procollagen C-endopeptidase enhancer 2-like n=1 Tax=Ranitomeya imitator TaxID=111125 RepID=UPI0037E9A68B
MNIIQTYKEGDLNIQEAGKIMSVQIIKCPILKKCASYLFMGKVDDFGRGRIVGDSFVISYRAQQHQILTSIAKKPC